MARYQNMNITPRTEGVKDDNKLRETCVDFESIFVKQMLDSMKKTVQKSGLNDGGFAEDIYQDMLYDEYAKEIAQTANLGIADMMYKQLSNEAVKGQIV
ncbi:MAG: rod-binding protein [Spirochaetales bacterium]|nr:rod-binding protein [Spirochaetales bacterium]